MCSFFELEIHRKLACFLCWKSFENQLVFCARNLLKVSSFSVLEIHANILEMNSFFELEIDRKLTCFLCWKSCENQLVFSMLEIHRKLARFLCQKSIENQLKFWARNLLKISSFSVLEIY